MKKAQKEKNKNTFFQKKNYMIHLLPILRRLYYRNNAVKILVFLTILA